MTTTAPLSARTDSADAASWANVRAPLSPLELATAIAERFMRTPRQAHYMWGVALIGVLDLYEATREQRFLDFYLQHLGDQPRFDFHLYQATGERRFLEGAEKAGEAYLAIPRRDREGCLLDPRGRYTVDVMSHLFTVPIIYGHVLRDHRYFDEALRQLEIPRSYLEDPATGLWFSRCGHGLHSNRPNPGLWSRGNGWLVAAWGRTMHFWDPAHPAYAHVLALWQGYCRSIARWQTPSGTFRQLLVRPGSFEEASGTALFATGFSQGVLHGTLPPELGTAAYRAFCGLRGLSDERGNLHNGSTYAGGYNFEYQYETCARYNEPHATGTAIAGCANVARLLAAGAAAIDPTPPAIAPLIVTQASDTLMTEAPDYRPPQEIAAPVLRRVLAMREWPANDLHGGTVRGLLRWYDWTRDASLLGHAERLLNLADSDGAAAQRAAGRAPCADKTSDAWRRGSDERADTAAPAVQQADLWAARGELAIRTADRATLAGLVQLVSAELPRLARDRNGLLLDEHGGYGVHTVATWVPLLARAAAVSGEPRYLDEACRQLLGHASWLEEPITKLWYSAFGRGAHPRRRTPGFWGLGNAMVLSATADLLQALPRPHERYADVVCLLRGLMEAIHTYFPVSGGWTQLLDRTAGSGSFPCTRTAALITDATGRAMLGGWIHHGYYAVTWGGILHLSELVHADGRSQWSSLPAGGLDTLEAYESHRATDDPAALGDVLAACAAQLACDKAQVDLPLRDGTLGAR